MNAVNFTAQGTRWRVAPVTTETMSRQHVPTLPGTGLLFTSADGEMRFLALAAESVPSPEVLARQPNAELSKLVQDATALER